MLVIIYKGYFAPRSFRENGLSLTEAFENISRNACVWPRGEKIASFEKQQTGVRFCVVKVLLLQN